MTFYIFLVFFLILGSAFCSFSEAVLIGKSSEMIHSLSKNRSKDNILLRKLMRNKDTLLSVVLLGNNICNGMAASVGTFIFVNILSNLKLNTSITLLINTLVITFLTFFLGEILPKSIAMQRELKIGKSVVLFVMCLNKALYPFVFATNWLIQKILRKKAISINADAILTQKELRMTVEAKHLEGKIFTHYRDMINGLLNLEEVNISSVMRHKSDVFAIDANIESFEDILPKVLLSGYSRFPIFEGSIDNIVGVLHIRDILEFYHNNNSLKNLNKEKLLTLANKPLFVTENASLYKQLLLFKGTRSHMAIVIDEFGVLVGIITLEDILEEIVGEIDDEYDKSEGPNIIVKDGVIVLEGDYLAHDLAKRLDIEIVDSDAKTVAGLIIDQLERLPTIGEKIEMFGYIVIVKGMKQNKITTVEMHKINSNTD